MDEDAPPTSATQSKLGSWPKYPETPMPDNNSEQDYEEDEQQSSQPHNTLFENAILILCVGICIAHLVTIWSVRADLNIILQYQTEHVAQYKHITHLLESKQQLQWQIVPADI